MTATILTRQPVRPLSVSGWHSAAVPGHRLLLWLTVAVVAVDWLTKAAAWRLMPGEVMINKGASWLVGPLNPWYVQPFTGALLDLVGAGALLLSGRWLLGLRISTGSWVGLALVWASWVSNAGDRWLAHHVLAPGSARGAVDWIATGDIFAKCNLADMIGFAGVLLALACWGRARLSRRATAAAVAAAMVLFPVSALAVDGRSTNYSLTLSSSGTAVRDYAKVRNGSVYISAGRYDWSVEAVDISGTVLSSWRTAGDGAVPVWTLPAGTNSVWGAAGDRYPTLIARNLQLMRGDGDGFPTRLPQHSAE